MKDSLTQKLNKNRKKAAIITVIGLTGLILFSTILENPNEESESPTEFNQADVMFMNMMIIHHDQAIKMAELAPNRTDNEHILELSRNISEAQRAENNQMAKWLRELGYQRPRDGHRMAGMASQNQMQELSNSEGSEFDQLFSDLMITHHEGGINMAMSFSRRGKNTELVEMERQMIETQQNEIEMMREWRETWS